MPISQNSRNVLLEKLVRLLGAVPPGEMFEVVGGLIEKLEDTPEKMKLEEAYTNAMTEWRIDRILGYSTPELRKLVRASLEESEVTSRFIDAQMEEEESD